MEASADFIRFGMHIEDIYIFIIRMSFQIIFLFSILSVIHLIYSFFISMSIGKFSIFSYT